MYRKKMGKKKDRRMFSKTASYTNKKNFKSSPQRGGFRI